MLSGCTIVDTLVPFRIQEVEELCDADFKFHCDFKVLSDIHPLNELPQDHLLSLNAAARIQVGPGHDFVILFLYVNGRALQISCFSNPAFWKQWPTLVVRTKYSFFCTNFKRV